MSHGKCRVMVESGAINSAISGLRGSVIVASSRMKLSKFNKQIDEMLIYLQL